MKEINEKYFQYNNSSTVNNSIDDELIEGEKILWRAKPKRGAYIWSNVLKMLPFVLIWLAIDVAFIVVLAKYAGDMPTFVWFILVPFFIIHLTPVWLWIYGMIRANIEHKNIEYAFTNKRIIMRSGLIGIDFRNIYYSDIVSVNLKVGIIDKLFKVGDIYLKAKTESVVLFDISEPYVVLKALQQISLDIKADIYFPNELRPSKNTGYNTDYELKGTAKEILEENNSSENK